MKTLAFLSAAGLVLLCSSCDKSPDTLVAGGYDEAAMDAAIARARAEVDSFLTVLASGQGEDFAVKAPIEDRGQTEHFWLTDIVYRDGEFLGVIGNDPGVVRNVKAGQKWTIKKQEISDWLYIRDGKMFGNYTLRPLLGTMPKDQAEKLRAILAEP
ncbi:MAG: DUF2314 domain-containing protein [Planctomycetaceae bacterium]|nr:MAG: DUF2314 domain-containing protein [Planctomycetaceae bacterium]